MPCDLICISTHWPLVTLFIVIDRYEHVFRKAGMRDRFSVGDYVKAMAYMYELLKEQDLGKLQHHNVH